MIFLEVATESRLTALRTREARRFGAAAVAPGGWRHEETQWFLEWASHYEDGTREGRSRPRHEAWLAKLDCAVLRLEGHRPLEVMVEEIMESL